MQGKKCKIENCKIFTFSLYKLISIRDERGASGKVDCQLERLKGLIMQEKILVGHKLRRFRKSIGLSQTMMAETLEISPSYLNLLEHNQRPLTVSLLLRLGNSFNIDLKDFAEDDAASLSTGLLICIPPPSPAVASSSSRTLR